MAAYIERPPKILIDRLEKIPVREDVARMIETLAGLNVGRIRDARATPGRRRSHT